MQNNSSLMSLVVLCFLICKAFFFTPFSSFHTFMCNVENFSALWKEMLKIRKSISCFCLQTLSKCSGCKILHFTFLGDVFRYNFALYIIVYKLKAELTCSSALFPCWIVINKTYVNIKCIWCFIICNFRCLYW